jgi:hypothetical protein
MHAILPALAGLSNKDKSSVGFKWRMLIQPGKQITMRNKFKLLLQRFYLLNLYL